MYNKERSTSMRLSTSTGNLSSKLGLEAAMEVLKDAGFDAFDFSVSNLTKWEKEPLMQEAIWNFSSP